MKASARKQQVIKKVIAKKPLTNSYEINSSHFILTLNSTLSRALKKAFNPNITTFMRTIKLNLLPVPVWLHSGSG